MLNINIDWLFQQRRSSVKKTISSEETFSYSDLNDLADNYCACLKSLDIKQGDNVAVLSENTPHFIAVLFGIWRAKAVPVPLNIKLTAEEIEGLLAASNSKCLIAQQGVFKTSLFGNTGIRVIKFPITGGPSSTPSIDYNLQPEQTALIMYTSGSSGAPKGVELSFANLYYSAVIANQILAQTEGDKWLASLPFYHIGGFSIIIRSIIYGTSMAIPASMNYMDIVSGITKYNPTLISLVPTNLKRMIEANVKPKKELRYVLLGGGPSETDLIGSALDDGWNIIKVYGSTETSSLISAVDCKKNRDKAGSSGKALAENQIRVLDEKLSPLPSRGPGEIAVSGSSVFNRYYKDESYSKSKFHGRYYLTGDYGYLDDEGYLYVLSRRTDLIISGGENISPFEIEEKLNTLENVINSCVFPLNDKEWGQIAAAAIMVRNYYKGVENAIREELKRVLPSFKIPKKIFIVNEIPRTSIGKPKRDEIKKLFSGEDAR